MMRIALILCLLCLGCGGNDAAAVSTSSMAGAGAPGDGDGSVAFGDCADPLLDSDDLPFAVTEAVDLYEVGGGTAAAIRESLNVRRPTEYDGRTDWFVSWNFETDDCVNFTWLISLDVRYQMPEWDRPDGTDDDLERKWTDYLDALWCHEWGHAQFGVDTALDALAAFESIDAAGDCDAVNAEASKRFDEILADYQADELDYDDVTDHGETMGARFP